jgi:hypothetical protein
LGVLSSGIFKPGSRTDRRTGYDTREVRRAERLGSV